jgi:hypothetical protein
MYNHYVVLQYVSALYVYHQEKLDYHNSRHHPSSCLIFETHNFGDRILSVCLQVEPT